MFLGIKRIFVMLQDAHYFSVVFGYAGRFGSRYVGSVDFLVFFSVFLVLIL